MGRIGVAENVSKSERTVSTGAAVAGNSAAAGNSGNGGGSDVRQSGYFWGQLAVEFYALFLLTAICSRDFAEVYQKLALETPAESRGVRKAKRWLCGAVYYTLWCGALFMIYLLG